MKTSVKTDVDGRHPTSTRRALWSTSTSRKRQSGRRRPVENLSGRRRPVVKRQDGRRRPVENVSGRRRPVENVSGRRRPVVKAQSGLWSTVDAVDVRLTFSSRPNTSTRL